MNQEYSYSVWKDESNIDRVCQKLLDNADMDWEFIPFPFGCTFTFFVAGSDIKVRFKCSEIESFKLYKPSDVEPWFLVLETHVRRWESELDGQELWSISIEPAVQIKMECRRFEWSIEQIADSERPV